MKNSFNRWEQQGDDEDTIVIDALARAGFKVAYDYRQELTGNPLFKNDRTHQNRHILVATTQLRNPGLKATGLCRITLRQRRTPLCQPGAHQWPHFLLGRLTHQHFDVTKIRTEALLAPQCNKGSLL